MLTRAETPEGISPKEAAERLFCTAAHVRLLLRTRKLRGSKIRGQWWIDPLSVRNYKAQQARR